MKRKYREKLILNANNNANQIKYDKNSIYHKIFNSKTLRRSVTYTKIFYFSELTSMQFSRKSMGNNKSETICKSERDCTNTLSCLKTLTQHTQKN